MSAKNPGHRGSDAKASTPQRWTCPPGRKLPPFGKVLAEAFLQGLQPINRQAVVYLDEWPPAEPALGVPVVCPADAAPESFDWRILAALDVFVRTHEPSNGARLNRLLSELVRVKPRFLFVLRPFAPHGEFIIPKAHGLEVQP
jgi:hypothetical protein